MSYFVGRRVLSQQLESGILKKLLRGKKNAEPKLDFGGKTLAHKHFSVRGKR